MSRSQLYYINEDSLAMGCCTMIDLRKDGGICKVTRRDTIHGLVHCLIIKLYTVTRFCYIKGAQEILQ